MDTKETGFLNVLADLSFPEKKIVVNPNDGFDLGLMMTDTTAIFHYGESPATWSDEGSTKGIYGNLYQRNDTRLGTIELSTSAVKKMGSPKRVRLHAWKDGKFPRILIESE